MAAPRTLRTLTETFEVGLSPERSDAADAIDGAALEQQFCDAVLRLIKRGIADDLRPVGKMRVTIEQDVAK